MDTSKINMAFTSIFYPVFMGRYILEAFLRRDDVNVWTAGPFSGTWIPWGRGMNVPEAYVKEPDFALPFGAGVSTPTLNYEVLQEKCPFPKGPDLWLEVNSVLPTWNKPVGRYAIIGTDPHVLEYSLQRAQADFFFCMQSPYMKYGDILLHYGYDPIWHSPTAIPWDKREFDVALIGLHYEQRTKLMEVLRAKGLKVAYDLGPAYDDAKAIYHNSRIGLNWSSQQDTTARVFELMAFGIVPVLNYVPDLEKLFEDGKHYLGFDNEIEAISKIEKTLAQPVEMAEIVSEAGIAIRNHSWDVRAQQILTDVGLVHD